MVCRIEKSYKMMVDFYSNGHGVIVFPSLAQTSAAVEVHWPMSRRRKRPWNRMVQGRPGARGGLTLARAGVGWPRAWQETSRDLRTSRPFHSREGAVGLGHHAHATPALRPVPRAEQSRALSYPAWVVSPCG